MKKLRKKKYIIIVHYDYEAELGKEKMVKAYSQEDARKILHRMMDKDDKIQMGGVVTIGSYGLTEFQRNQATRKYK